MSQQLVASLVGATPIASGSVVLEIVVDSTELFSQSLAPSVYSHLERWRQHTPHPWVCAGLAALRPRSTPGPERVPGGRATLPMPRFRPSTRPTKAATTHV